MSFFCALGTIHSILKSSWTVLEEVAGMKHDLLLLLLLEKLREIRAQRLQDVLQRRNAGAGQVSFHLRKKALGQFASRSELFQRQVIGRAQLL